MESNEPLIDELNKLTENKYKFLLKSATLNKGADFCVIEILYRDGIILTPKLKKSFEDIVLSLLPKKYNYEISFIKNFISEDRIFGECKEYLEKNFPSIYFAIKQVKLEDKTFNISIEIDELSYAHAKKINLDFLIQKFFKNLYEEFDFALNYSKQNIYSEDKKELSKQNYIDDVNLEDIRKYEVLNVEQFIGEPIEPVSAYIKDKQNPEPLVVLAGKMKNIKDLVIKRKQKETRDSNIAEEVGSNENITKQGGVSYERKLFKWSLEDFTGIIPCVFFSNKENQPKFLELENDAQILVRGKIEEDKYNGGVSLIVQDISRCELPNDFEEKIVYKTERPYYEFVEPEKIVTYTQNNLMNFMEEKTTPEFLKNKTFVCYDFETTGLHYERGDKIIEIGAVKIENGKITEKFMSYVDPERKIPAESSAISGITDEDVAGAPKDFEVLQDFFKFTRNAIIIGYNNINFDNIFLIGQGKKCRWNFSDNETDDVFKHAQKLIHGVKNYRLGTIAEKLGVVLDNAHRAVYDALATAEIFIKLAEMM